MFKQSKHISLYYIDQIDSFYFLRKGSRWFFLRHHKFESDKQSRPVSLSVIHCLNRTVQFWQKPVLMCHDQWDGSAGLEKRISIHWSGLDYLSTVFFTEGILFRVLSSQRSNWSKQCYGLFVSGIFQLALWPICSWYFHNGVMAY